MQSEKTQLLSLEEMNEAPLRLQFLNTAPFMLASEKSAEEMSHPSKTTFLIIDPVKRDEVRTTEQNVQSSSVREEKS